MLHDIADSVRFNTLNWERKSHNLEIDRCNTDIRIDHHSVQDWSNFKFLKFSLFAFEASIW